MVLISFDWCCDCDADASIIFNFQPSPQFFIFPEMGCWAIAMGPYFHSVNTLIFNCNRIIKYLIFIVLFRHAYLISCFSKFLQPSFSKTYVSNYINIIAVIVQEIKAVRYHMILNPLSMSIALILCSSNIVGGKDKPTRSFQTLQ